MWEERYGESISESSLDLIWSVAVSIFAIGGMAGGFSGGYVANRLGRSVTWAVTWIVTWTGGGRGQ